MKPGIKVAVAAAVVAALVLGSRALGWWGTPAPRPAPPAAPAPIPGPAKAASATPATTPTRTALGDAFEPARDDDPRGTLRLEGQVIDDTEAPVGGARVAIDANPPREVVTEADGSFTFEGLLARDYRLEASAGDGYAGPARLRLGPDAEPVTLRMHRAGAVEVVVTEAGTARPVAGATVELRATVTWTAVTGADGVATLRGVGQVWTPLAVRAGGFAPAATMVAASGDAAAPTRVAIVLAHGAPLTGRVVDGAGHGVAHARVDATSAAEPFPVVDGRRDGVLTGADGAFTLPVIAAGTWRVTATAGNHAAATSPPLTVDGVHPREGIVLTLGVGGVVRGTVRDGAGQPVPGADVRVVVAGQVDWRARRSTYSDAAGRFELTALPRRAVDVVAQHPKGSSAIAHADLAATATATVDLALAVTGAITGVVVDSAGQPLADAQVSAEPAASPDPADRTAWSVRGLPQAISDGGGHFAFAGLPPGSYQVRASRPGAGETGQGQGAGATARPGDPPLRLVVPADGSIVGKVAFDDGSAPALFTIALDDGARLPVASPGGAFALPAASGRHVITVAGPGFVEQRVRDVDVREQHATDVGAVTVAKGRAVSGRVLDPSGVPVEGADVAAGLLLTGGGAELYIEDESLGARATRTDADGRFLIAGFGPQPITVVAGKDGVGRSTSVRLPAGPDSASLELLLAPVSGLDGAVTRSGAPAADTIVIANPIGATSSNFFTSTGPDGTFALDALTPGPYVVQAMFGGGGPRPKDLFVRRVEVEPGRRARLDLDATPGAVTLAVTVARDDGAAVDGASVFALEAAIAPVTMEDLRDGSRLPVTGDKVTAVYVRTTQAGAIDIASVRAGLLTVCAAPVGGMLDDPAQQPVRCAPITITAAPARQAIALTLPAAWFAPPAK